MLWDSESIRAGNPIRNPWWEQIEILAERLPTYGQGESHADLSLCSCVGQSSYCSISPMTALPGYSTVFRAAVWRDVLCWVPLQLADTHRMKII